MEDNSKKTDNLESTFLLSLEDYKNDYSRRKSVYLNLWKNRDELTFIEEEILLVLSNIDSCEISIKKDNLGTPSDNEHTIQLREFFTLQSKKSIISQKLIVKFLKKRKNEILKIDEQQINKDLDNDLSNITAAEKIVRLHKLGVIDYLLGLDPFNTSINALAGEIAEIIEEKKTTIQPYLNQLLSIKDLTDNKHPYKNSRMVEKVENHFLSIGFKLK